MTNLWGMVAGQGRPLSKQIEAKVKAYSRPTAFTKIKEWFSQLYAPSWPSFVIVALFAGIFIGLSHWDIGGIPLFSKSKDYANLIAVHAGIGAIIFALVIFIAESLRDDTDKDRARVLLKVSLLFPLTVTEIFVFFGFWGNVNWIMTVAVGIVGCLAVYSISMLLLTLLSPFRFSRVRIALLKDRIKVGIGGAIDQRYGNQILFEALGKEIKLSYYPPIGQEEEESFVVFLADKNGVITDIRMDLLEKISDILEKEANKNGYSFDKSLSRVGNTGSGSRVTSEKKSEYKKDNERYLLKKYRDEVDDEYKGLICAKKDVIKDPAVIREITELTKDAFVIGPGRNFSEEVIAELDGVQDQFLVAIDAGRLTRIKEFGKAYLALAESFLELLEQHGGGYTYEQAKKELGAFIGEWSEMRWLADSIADLLFKSFATDSKEVISDIAYLPVAICIRAMKVGDHYLFQKFINFPTLLYSNAAGRKDDVRDFMIARSYTWLKELVDFYIEPPIRDSSKVEEVEKYRDFGLPIFVAFLRLCKEAVETNDPTSLTKILAAFEDLYDGFDHPRSPDARQLQWMLDDATDPNDKERIEKQLQVQKTREAVQAEIVKKKREMLFGLAAWALKRYWQNPGDVYAKAIFEIIEPHLPRDIKILTDIFNGTHNPQRADFWGWNMWDIPSDGHAHSIDTSSNVERLYAVEMLKILSGLPPERFATLSLPPSEDMAFLARPASGFGTLLGQIEATPANWSFALTPAAIAQIPNFKTLLKKVEEEQEQKEKQIIANASLSSTKMGDFKESFWKAFDETAIMRNIAEREGLIKKKSCYPKNTATKFNRSDSIRLPKRILSSTNAIPFIWVMENNTGGRWRTVKTMPFFN